MKDLYESLGIKNTASCSEIKKAYKKLASKYHPDKNPDDPKAKAMFQVIQEAYEILSNPEKRKRYDETGAIDDQPSTLDVAIKMVFDLYIFHASKNNFKKKNYFKVVKKDLNTALKACETDIRKTTEEIDNFQYLMDNTSSGGLLDDFFEGKMLSLCQLKSFCENGKIVISEALEVIDGNCKYKGEGEEKEMDYKLGQILY